MNTQQMLGCMLRTPNGVKPKIVVVSIADHDDWINRIFDKNRFIEKFDNLIAREEAHGISK